MRTAQIPEDAVTAELPNERWGHFFEGTIEVHVRAVWDEALGGLAADIYIVNKAGDCRHLPDCLVPGIIEDIKRFDPGAFDEIERASGRYDKAA